VAPPSAFALGAAASAAGGGSIAVFAALLLSAHRRALARFAEQLEEHALELLLAPERQHAHVGLHQRSAQRVAQIALAADADRRNAWPDSVALAASTPLTPGTF